MAEDPPTETDSGEVERLPWLKRVDEEPERDAGAGRPLVYAAGAAVALVAVVGLGYAVLQRPHDQGTGGEAETNLAGLGPDQALIEGQAAGNQAAPLAPPRPSSAVSPAHHRHRATAAARPAAETPRAARPALSPPHERRLAERPSPAPKRAAAEPPSPHKRAVAERPSPPPRHAVRPERAPPPQHRAARRAPAMPAPMTGPGTIVQLGAFSTAARADQAWLDLSQARHLSRFPHRIEQARVHGRTVYRLRVLVSGRMGECGRRARCAVVRHGR